MQSGRDPLAPRLEPSCATEPIHVPGSIQPHGLLLLLDGESGKLVHWAGNFDWLLGVTPAADRSPEKLLGAPLNELIRSRKLVAGDEAAYVGCILSADGPRLAVQVHRTGRFVAVELQHAGEERGSTPALEQVRAIAAQIASQPGLHDACAAAAEEMRAITGYDRIMIYQFLEDGSGSVIAEARAADASAFVNHRFPSSDIPRQAMELYRRNLIRTIPDVAYSPIPIETAPEEIIDMTHCVLRSVSPVHIQYLKNMDVGASMSVSLLVDGELWGLIACHHQSALGVPVGTQLLADISDLPFAFILSFGQAKDPDWRTPAGGLESGLRRLRSSSEPDRTLRLSAKELKGLVRCGGFALLADGELVADAGRIPAPEQLRALAPLVDTQLEARECYWTDRVSEDLPTAPSIAATAAGVLAVRLDASQPLLALWFRPEQVEEVQWAGDPGHKDEAPDTLAPLSPRRSFATWRETVRGRSRPWMWHEINTVELFRSRAGFTLQRAGLKRLNLQLAEANAGLSALATTDPLTGLPTADCSTNGCASNGSARPARKSLGWSPSMLTISSITTITSASGRDECLKQVAGAIDAARRRLSRRAHRR